MKKFLSHIATSVLAFYFLVAGTGFNVVKYCCDSCSVHGIVEVARQSCGTFHHYQQQKHSDDCCETGKESAHDEDLSCSNENHHPQGCHLLRLTTETPTLVAHKTGVFHQLLLNLQFIQPAGYRVAILLPALHVPEFSPPDRLPARNGRQILAAKSVLII